MRTDWGQSKMVRRSDGQKNWSAYIWFSFLTFCISNLNMCVGEIKWQREQLEGKVGKWEKTLARQRVFFHLAFKADAALLSLQHTHAHYLHINGTLADNVFFLMEVFQIIRLFLCQQMQVDVYPPSLKPTRQLNLLSYVENCPHVFLSFLCFSWIQIKIHLWCCAGPWERHFI